MNIDFVNSTYAEVEQRLLGGQTPREVADLLQESVANVMGVWKVLRDKGAVEARNFTQQAASAPPAETSAPDLLVRAAKIDDKRIQGALARARKAMTDLAGLVEKWDGKSAARNRIARLEAELRLARAELKGAAPTDATPGDGVKPRCAKCGRECANGTGLAAHARRCTAAAVAS